MDNLENHTLELLRRLHQGQQSLIESVNNLKESMDLQFHAIRDQLSGQLLSEIDVRKQMSEFERRIQRIERRLELRDEAPE